MHQQCLARVVQQSRALPLCRTAKHQQKPIKHILRATPSESSEFEGVEGNEVLQDALMQQLRVQIETQTLKEEIKEDLKGKAEEMKQRGDEVRSVYS